MNSKPSRTPTSSSNPSRNSQGNFRAVEPERKKQLAAFQKTAGFRFRSPELLNLSFVHRSVSNETGTRLNNERLEFLGDSILGSVCATILYEKYPEKSEGELAKIMSVTVSEEVLCTVARGLRLDSFLLLGKGEELSGGRDKQAILADTLEALIGALYLDAGYAQAFRFVDRFFSPEIERITGSGYWKDYKSLLQEACQQMFRCYPSYRMVKLSGPDHDHVFWMEVSVGGTAYGPGSGRSKKAAEQEAAKIAYRAIHSAAGDVSEDRFDETDPHPSGYPSPAG
ncbi:MAG: ribonuclease III [Treponema sp.]|nr:ribonuclease III [Treponema sp.]